ncbi:MAG: nucleoside-diphosphate sugar epimerase/dehydratase [Chloroflexi bacterium]|nr:nucleoside-diphosphate sugar epimerase/dehydratase [Chloroflexota bacterium]
MLKRIRNRHFFLLDLFFIPLAVYFSYVLRLDRLNIAPFWPSWILYCVCALALTPFIFKWVGVYGRYWIYASIEELALLVGGLSVAAVLAGILNLILAGIYPAEFVFPRSVPFLYLLLGLAATAGPRLAVRASTSPQWRWGTRSPTEAVLIAGAGDAGNKILREIQANLELGLHVVGFVDDDPLKQNVTISGTPVLGVVADIPTLVRDQNLTKVIIAMPSASGQTIRQIVQMCEQAKVATQTIPALHNLLNGRVTINQLRQVQIEDLLRREPVQTDTSAVHNLLRGRRVLITGAGGSIGSELCRQVLACAPAELILLGHGENSIFTITHELRRLAPDIPLTPLIADVRFGERIEGLFEKYRPQVVFHAAAHKHVPLMEQNPCEAITNNVLGTRNVLHAARTYGVEQFVMVSTDKAVNPTSIMGASKRTAELLVLHAAQQSELPYVAVRFGNVLGSRGSVVLTFQQQIAAGGPVTVTHPEMIRFFMTIPEAVQLVLQAAVIGRGGEIFILDMGEPVKIVDLAHDLITLSGLEVGRDIEINFSGIRPGEKLYEELFIQGEKYQRTEHHKIFIAKNASTLLANSYIPTIESLIESAQHDDSERVHTLLRQLIPEHQLAGQPVS